VAVTTLILLRHGRSSANTSGVLAGRSPGVELDDTGKGQAWALAQRLKPVPISAVVTSPMERCQQTVAPLLAGRALSAQVDDQLAEVDYGDWTGREINNQAKEALWRVVQQHPSAAVFPGAIRAHDAKVVAEHGPGAVWVACSHGDVIKSVLADALGLHLDSFQRIVVDPCSISVVHYTEIRPFVSRVNDTGGDVSGLLPPPKRGRRRRPAKRSSDAVVGGSTGVS
jgi:probable phosphomutase (TIGR03848 family)